MDDEPVRGSEKEEQYVNDAQKAFIIGCVWGSRYPAREGTFDQEWLGASRPRTRVRVSQAPTSIAQGGTTGLGEEQGGD